MKKKKYAACMLILILLHIQSINAQVTIGIDREPMTGALLELSNSPDKTTSTKGLSLPRVLLEYRELLSPMFKLNATNTGYEDASTLQEEEKHIGLMVYNIGNFDVCDYSTLLPGVYTWSGAQWDNMQGKEPEYEMGPTVEVLIYQGESYYTRQFGNAGRWMTQNLRTRQYDVVRTDGKAIIGTIDYVKDFSNINYINWNQSMTTNVIDGDNETVYSWRAATAGKSGLTGLEGTTLSEFGDKNQEKIQGICPANWHLPSDYEFTLLENEIIKNYKLYVNTDIVPSIPLITLPFTGTEPNPGSPSVNSDWKGTIHGFAMRAACEVYDRYNAGSTPGDNVRGGSLRARYGGFDAQLAGFTLQSHTPRHSAYYWSSSSSGFNGTGVLNERTHAIPRHIDTRDNNRGVDRGAKDRRHMFSVRCVKDNTNDSQD